MLAAAPAVPPPPAALFDRALAWRDRLLTSAAFRRWAAAFPLTRPLARQRARALFDLCAGFVYSQILAACVQTRVFDLLAEGPQTAAALAPQMGLPLSGAERLLAGAVALKLLNRRTGNRFGLGPLGAAMVDNAGVREMVKHHAMLYADLRDPVALLRGDQPAGALAAYWPYAEYADPAGLHGRQVADYTALMAASQPLVADEILNAYLFARHRCLLDVGGGDGTFLSQVAARAPELQLLLFDLPPVAERAQARFAASGLSGRARAAGGDFRTDNLPAGADAISLVRVVHDHDDATALHLMRAAHAALPPGGTLVLAEPMAETPGAEQVGDAYFGFYLLAMGRGRPRSAAVLTAMLREAGFGDVRAARTATPLLTSVLTARKLDTPSR